MKNLIKKYGAVMVMGLVIVILVIKEGSRQDGGSVAEIKNKLQGENNKHNLEIEQSRQKAAKLLEEIKDKTEIVKELDCRISKTRSDYSQLKEQLASFPAPVDGASFQQLEECQEKYGTLATELNICQAAAEKGDEALTLCLDQVQQQKRVIDLQESRYGECLQQGQWLEQKCLDTETAMNRLENVYQRKLFKKNLLKYGVGIVAGMAIGYLVLKHR
jgi:septal ring factor EnvC (AmiA/AmiB activator)